MLTDHFMVNAAIGATIVALAAAPIGCFIVWQRMAFFGDAIAHSAILGVTIALYLSLPIFWGVLSIALLAGASLAFLNRDGYDLDTQLGVIAHTGLASGLVAASFLPGAQLDLFSFLFGDILAVGKNDLTIIAVTALLVSGVVLWRWGKFVMVSLSTDLARASGINPRHERLILILLIAALVSIALKITGALLIGAILIIPAALAARFAKSPHQMVILACIFGVCASIAGLGLSFWLDTPAGPSIVLCISMMFFLSFTLKGAG